MQFPLTLFFCPPFKVSNSKEDRCGHYLNFNFLFMFLKYKECQDPLGMENGAISDGQISASSELSTDHASTKGRLILSEGTWLPLKDDGDQWLQIDLRNNNIIVKRVATQELRTEYRSCVDQGQTNIKRGNLVASERRWRPVAPDRFAK